jgi:hypothetical protein
MRRKPVAPSIHEEEYFSRPVGENDADPAAANKSKEVLPGVANPLGAQCVQGRVNFSVYSRDAIGMDLGLFDDERLIIHWILKRTLGAARF